MNKWECEGWTHIHVTRAPARQSNTGKPLGDVFVVYFHRASSSEPYKKPGFPLKQAPQPRQKQLDG